MTRVKNLVTLVSLLWAAVSGQQSDVTVYSRYMSSQILPCTFQTGDDFLVHWLKDNAVVHSYYHGEDQLDHQIQQFRGRTSLFHDELSRGNSSLLLKKVQVSDRGRYRCYTSTLRGRQESFFNLEVEAPVTKVSIIKEGDQITCLSEGIYPKPKVTWSKNKTGDTRIEQTEQQLYNIWSSVLKFDDDVNNTCHVSNLWSNRSATLTTARGISLSGNEDKLHCSSLKSPLTSVTWKFYDKIIAQREDHLNVTERWRDHVKDLSISGSLSLQNLSPDLSGIYMCEVTNEEERHVKIIYMLIAEPFSKALEWYQVILCTTGLVLWLIILYLQIKLGLRSKTSTPGCKYKVNVSQTNLPFKKRRWGRKETGI